MPVADPTRSALKSFFLAQARDELFDAEFYRRLAERDTRNRQLLLGLVAQEEDHLEFWLRVAGAVREGLRLPRLRLHLALLGAKIFGPTFTIRLIEKAEQKTIARYREILSSGVLPREEAAELERIVADEEFHEKAMEERVGDERVTYLASAVLGVNDALVELVGALTGLVSSITSPRLIGFAGLVVGVAAALSMAASNFLAVEARSKNVAGESPARAAAYTGSMYLLVVLLLVLPFFLSPSRTLALPLTWLLGFLVILGFAYYSSVLLDRPFVAVLRKLLVFGAGVAVVTFLIGKGISLALGVSV